MVNKIRQCWFGFLLAVFMVGFLALSIIVAIAPHNDDKMRGFAPCTYEMANNIGVYSAERNVMGVVGAISSSYKCYLDVMGKGVENWYNDKQDTPWENYIFEPVSMEIPNELSEPFSEELLKANKLDEKEGDIFDFKEIDDEQE